ncbi:putative eukaryotic translation initiation factor 3, gamma subunit [Hortaea werneckii]|nr:putative eukaryotic translation initiation factor 3, gamma subunit [Hortaea werneckii]KAI7324087.1 putative eukaryotic translation initiation factor 3, gamma subunit [Hortaea werneckii]
MASQPSMPKVHSCIKPNAWLFLRLPNEMVKCIEIKPNQIIDVGKIGSFPSNFLLGRPYYYTYEIQEKRPDESHSRLRIVPPSELNAEIVAEESTPNESRGDPATPASGNNDLPASYDLLTDDAAATKTNRLTVDDASRQALSQPEIEELKKTAQGKEVIEKILAGHAGLDEKTIWSKAKYMLRKRNKYLKRFTVLPMDTGNLIDHILEKEPARILEMREETLGLMMAWSNAHTEVAQEVDRSKDGKKVGGGRWLVVDETGGLVVAAMAERMNLLHKPEEKKSDGQGNGDAAQDSINGSSGQHSNDVSMPDAPETTNGSHSAQPKPNAKPESQDPTQNQQHRDFPTPAPTNTITLLHPAVQPNISLLKHFGYDSNGPDTTHPLHTHLKPLSWLQLLHPTDDPTYAEPHAVPDTDLAKWKSGKRGTYFKKRRRWERCRTIVDETREGGFDGLIVASNMDPATILPHTVPLIRGGGHVVVYAPTIEPLVNLMDLYSRERRTAYIQLLSSSRKTDTETRIQEAELREDFPVDPRLLLAPTLQTSRVREWQVLPGRTHPNMTGRGGSEGFVFTARKVVPLEGAVEARGNFGKKRKVVAPSGSVAVGSGGAGGEGEGGEAVNGEGGGGEESKKVEG